MSARSLGDELSAAAAAHPAAPAVVHDGEVLSYGALRERATALAGLLPRPARDGPLRVGLLGRNGPEYVTAYWAVLLAGATSVELNPGLGEAELRAQLRHADPVLLVGERDAVGRLGGAAVGEGEFAAAALDPAAAEVAPALAAALGGGRLPPAAPLRPVPADALASIVYTSGTTGRPRGVCLSHRSLVWTARAIAASLGLPGEDPGERLLGALPLFYTYGKSVLHLATLLRAPILFSRRLLSAPSLLRALGEQGVTHLSLVPFLANLLLELPGFRGEALPELRRITVAGGALGADGRAELLRRFPGRVVPMYGLTEASTRVSCLPAAEAARRPGSCGRPLAGVSVRIVAADGRPLAPGEEGEIQVRGPNLMQGYWGDPQASEAALADGWLRTGDLGSLDADGYLTVSGRLKDLIKVMGESVSAESVEAVIATHPGVSEVAVRGVAHPRTGEAIAAFVVPRPGASPSADEIRRLCGRELGRARIPAHVSFVAALPRTASGKVRRHALALE